LTLTGLWSAAHREVRAEAVTQGVRPFKEEKVCVARDA
jgi:hypothetical protein